MAHVAITDKLINDVRSKINTMMNREIESELPEMAKSYSIDVSELFNICAWGDHLHLKAQLPKEWVNKAGTDATINIVRDGTKDSTIINARFLGVQSAVVPPNHGWQTSTTKIEVSKLAELPDTLAGVRELRQRIEDNKARQALVDKWREVERNIVELLKSAPSLNTAVKFVPTLRMYLTSEYLERLDRKVEKNKPASLEVKFDIDVITAAAVGAQLAGA